jgi:hypothetical protein
MKIRYVYTVTRKMESPGSTLANAKEQFLLCVKGNAREELYAGDDDETIKVELQVYRSGKTPNSITRDGTWKKVA